MELKTKVNDNAKEKQDMQAAPSVNEERNKNFMKDRSNATSDTTIAHHHAAHVHPSTIAKEVERGRCVKKTESYVEGSGNEREINQLGGRGHSHEVNHIDAVEIALLNNNPISGHDHLLPHGIEVICGEDGKHGIIEVRSNSQVYHQILKGTDKVVLWNGPTTTHPLEGSRQFRREKRKQHRCIINLFEKNADGLYSIAFSQYEVKTRSMTQCQIVRRSPNFGTPVSVFHPFAFFKDGQSSGGAYFNFSSTSPPMKMGKMPAPLKKVAIKKIITGLCLRPNLLMVDENDEFADVVDKLFYNRRNLKETKIVDFKSVAGVHPHESANVEMLRNLFPFFAVISQDSSPSLFFHWPLPEYQLQGISLFLRGGMTIQVLDLYADLLSSHASKFRLNLVEKLESAKIHFSSPLDVLVQNAVLPVASFARQFFQDLGIPLGEIVEQGEFGQSVENKVAVLVLESLKEQPGIAGDAWKRISEGESVDEDDLSMWNITKWSNAVHVAIQSFGSACGEVAVVDEECEMPLVLKFKKYIQTDSSPSLHCFHWLMPVTMSSLGRLWFLPVDPNKEFRSSSEMEEMVRSSSMQISKSALL